MTRIIILATPSTLSAQLREIQLTGIVKSGPDIMQPLPVRSGGTWDGRVS